MTRRRMATPPSLRLIHSSSSSSAPPSSPMAAPPTCSGRLPLISQGFLPFIPVFSPCTPLSSQVLEALVLFLFSLSPSLWVILKSYPSLPVPRGGGGSSIGSGGGNVAEKRANHNAIERARRDSLNTRFQDIADCIPQLRDLKKPSKSIIMHKTLEYVKVSQKKHDHNNKEIAQLKKENERLRQEAKLLKAALMKLSPTELESLGLTEHAQSPLPTTPPQEGLLSNPLFLPLFLRFSCSSPLPVESGFVKNEIFEDDDDDVESPMSSREHSAVPHRPHLTVNLSQFDAPIFAERGNGESAMEYDAPYITGEMMNSEFIGYHNQAFQHYRGSFSTSLNSSTMASPEGSYPGSEYLEGQLSFFLSFLFFIF